MEDATEPCTWCGNDVDSGDGFRAYEQAGERRAVFCRLEHVVPWAIQGPHWDAGTLTERSTIEQGVGECSHCGAALTDIHALLVRHRGEARIPDGFCSVDHLAAWAKAGGRWQ